MGLFTSKAEKEEKREQEKRNEEFVKQKLEQCPLLDMIMESLLNNDEKWITTRQSYYDSGIRKVSVVPDEFEVKWYTEHSEEYVERYDSEGKPKMAIKSVEDIKGRVGYSYTKSGYLPLHEYETVSKDRVCELWISVVCERMQAIMPECKFISPNLYAKSFEYIVPALVFKDWF